MKTVWVAWIFNADEFAKATKEAVAALGSKEIAQLMGVSVTTINKYASGSYSHDFPYPSMTNFLIMANLTDRSPCDFFTTGE